MWLKHEAMLKEVVRFFIAVALTATLMLSSMLAGCLGGNLENDSVYVDEPMYESPTPPSWRCGKTVNWSRRPTPC